jgi:hypothetical protein
MNKKNMYKFLTVVCFSFLGITCKTEGPASVTSDASGAVQYQPISDKRSIILYPELKEKSPRMSFDLALLDVNGPGPVQSLILGALYQGLSPGNYADSLITLFEGQYKAERNPEEPKSAEFPASWNWEYSETFKVLARTSHTAVLSQKRYYYIGGAHGMQEEKYFVFDLDEVKLLRPEDLFKKGSEPVLQEYIMEVLRAQYGLAPGAPLSGGGFFEDSVAVSEDFFLSREGIGFQWDVYEIAPYSMGSIEIVIPYKKINDLFTPRGLSLIKEF